MAVTKEITRLEKSAAKLSFTVPKDDVRMFYDQSLNEIIREIQIKGFRKGKVPKNVVEQKFKGVLQEQILNELISKTVLDAINADDFPKDDKPLPYSDPQVVQGDDGGPKLSLDTDFSFAVTYDVYPKLENLKCEGFEATVDDAEVTQADIDRELEAIRERNAIVLEREENAPARKGDVVTLDYCELDTNGKEIPAKKREDFTFTVGDGLNYYKFDEEITGIKQGETKIITKTMPADFHDEELAGKTVNISIKIKSVKEKKLPALDDEFAQDVDEKFNTLADLVNSVKKRLEDTLEDARKRKRRQALFDKILEANPLEIPASMVQAEMYARLSTVFGASKRFPEFATQFLNNDPTLENARPEIERNIKIYCIQRHLAEEFKFEVSDADIEKEIDTIAGRAGMEREEIVQFYREPAKREELVESLKLAKVNDFLLEKNTIKPGAKVSYLDIAG
ncbi:MAG: trigger factor [Spirochaetaceae bacterium]|nr:trigger factor [Spirochaetaceae bacterium]